MGKRVMETINFYYSKQREDRGCILLQCVISLGKLTEKHSYMKLL